MEFQYKVLAVVKFNDNEALVIDKQPVLKYKLSGGCITGTDGVFAECLYYEPPFGRFKAFGGREFNITLEDGEVIKCNGQYWDGVKDEHIKSLGFTPGHAAVNSIDDLKKCYVFIGRYANIELFNKLRSTYDGKVWEYYEYDNYLREQKKAIVT